MKHETLHASRSAYQLSCFMIHDALLSHFTLERV